MSATRSIGSKQNTKQTQTSFDLQRRITVSRFYSVAIKWCAVAMDGKAKRSIASVTKRSLSFVTRTCWVCLCIYRHLQTDGNCAPIRTQMASWLAA